MNYVLFAPFFVFALVSIQYLLEVHLGCSANMYDGESGVLSDDCRVRKSSPSQFLGKLLPLQLAAIALPLLPYDLLSAALAFFLALLLFCLYRNKLPARRTEHVSST